MTDTQRDTGPGAASIRVGSNLHRIRQYLGLSQADLVFRLRTAGHDRFGRQTTISRIERGRQVVSVDALVALADVLGVTPTRLLEETQV